MIHFEEKVVLVTGGSRGIGEATVRALSRAGARVVLHHNRGQEKAELIASEVGRDRCHLLSADLAASSVPKLWEEALAWQGRIDVLINNAGVYEPASIADSPEKWAEVGHRTLQINLVAAADLCREAILHFRERGGGGTIVNVASRAAFRGDDPEYIHYAASKGGVIALTRTVARGFAAEGVLAYAVAPGLVKTEMIGEVVGKHGEAELARDIPIGAIAPPEDVANVVSFLASGAAPHATGTTIDVNGASYVR